MTRIARGSVAAPVEIAGGVDTHQDTHTAAVVDAAGRMLGHRTFPTTDVGYRGLLAWLGGFGTLRVIGVEGTGAYGGRTDDRPGLASCLKALRRGGRLVVWKLDRLGRNLHHLVNTVHDLTARGVGLKVLTGQGAAIDTTTAAGNWSSASSPPWPSSNANSSPNAPSPVWPPPVLADAKAAGPSR